MVYPMKPETVRVRVHKIEHTASQLAESYSAVLTRLELFNHSDLTILDTREHFQACRYVTLLALRTDTSCSPLLLLVTEKLHG